MRKICTVNEVKNTNISAVRQAIRSLPAFTKNDVSKMTGLSVATCNTLLNELAGEGEILEIEQAAPAMGRPPKAYRYHAGYRLRLCMYLSMDDDKTEIHAAVCDLLGEILCEREFDREPDEMTEALSDIRSEITPQLLSAIAKDFMREYPEINCLSLGIPGYYHKGKVITCGIKSLIGLNLAGILTEELGIRVMVGNDVNTMAYGIHRLMCEEVGHEAEQPRDLVMIALFRKRPPGAGIIIDGHILQGCTSSAGEVARLPFTGGKVEELVMSEDGGLQVAAETAVAAAVIVNPPRIVFVGGALAEDKLPGIREIMQRYIPGPDMPKLLYCNDVRNYYYSGLCALAGEDPEPR